MKKMLSACLVLVILSACKKQKTELVALDPTFLVKEVITDPDFRDKITYDTDSLCTSDFELVANQRTADRLLYEWNINNTIIKGKKYFTYHVQDGNKVTVTLTIKRQGAFGNIVETKSATRTFMLNRSTRLDGIYKGYFNGVNEPATVTINTKAVDKIANTKAILITSNIKPYDTLFAPAQLGDHYILNRRIYFDHGSKTINATHLAFPKGLITLDKDGKTLSINLEAVNATTGVRVKMGFVGYKQ